MEILFQINREFDGIERRYNRLIDQKESICKTCGGLVSDIFWRRVMWRKTTQKTLIRLLNMSDRKDEILKKLGERMGMTERFCSAEREELCKTERCEKESV